MVSFGHNVTVLTQRNVSSEEWHGVKIIRYRVTRRSTPEIHPWAVDFETKIIRGEACFRAALELKAHGFTPDIILAHPGWGESLFLKEVWPQTKLGIYCEFFYHTHGADVGFDPEFPVIESVDYCKVVLKNLNNLAHFRLADAGLSPTQWQASTFPEPFRSKITVIHDGIDTTALVPDPKAWVKLNDNLTLTCKNEIVTFVNRNLEPYRGIHVFMRALPELLHKRPQAHVVIVGGDEVSYGTSPADGLTWRECYIKEIQSRVCEDERRRIHFVGRIPYRLFVSLLQVSTVHVYLTYPFVLSWSLLEAMSVGCAIVASDTEPVQEVIHHNETGRLVNFFDSNDLVKNMVDLLERPELRQRLGHNARRFVKSHYDLQTICLPRQIEWVESIHFT